MFVILQYFTKDIQKFLRQLSTLREMRNFVIGINQGKANNKNK